MSGLVGLFYSDGRVATSSDIAADLATLSHRAGQPVTATLGSTVMGSMSAEADSSRNLIVTLDGRVAHRETLIEELQIPIHSSDAAIVTAAWRRWGRDCAERIGGDLTAVISDGHTVFAFRDLVGFRPFYYRTARNRFRWATEVRSLVYRDRPPINEGMVAEYLADHLVGVRETLFRDVCRLPPAHALECRADGQISTWQYWHPNQRSEIRYRSQGEYDEHFRVLFRDAVAHCVRGSDSVALWYSGGVDSSAIASELAARRDAGEGPHVETVSMSVPGEPEDESRYFTEGARHFKLSNTAIPNYFGSADDFSSEASRTLDVPEPANSISGKGIWQTLAARHCRLALTGLGGDDWFLGSQLSLADDLRRLRLGAVVRRLRRDPPLMVSSRAWPLLRHSLVRQLPSSWMTALRTIKPSPPLVPAHIREQFARRVSLEGRLRAPIATLRWSTHARAMQYDAGMDPMVIANRELQSRVAAHWQIETRHPFHYRPLIEFALALPAEQLWPPGTPRFIVLHALTARLPAAVHQRPDGANYTALMVKALEAIGANHHLAQAEKQLPDWIEWPVIRVMAERLVAAPPTARRELWKEAWTIWQILRVAWWFEAVSGPEVQSHQHGRV